MPSPEDQELEQLIYQLTDATRNGLVAWKSLNPTTFVFDRVESLGVTSRIVLQRVERQTVTPPPNRVIKQEPNYVFQGFEVRAGQSFQKLSVTGATQPDLTPKLQELFQLISSGLSRQGLDFLRNLIPKSGS